MSLNTYSAGARWRGSLILVGLSFLSALGVRAGDVTDYAVFKGQFFLQTNSGTAVLQMSNEYAFRAFADLCMPNVVSAGSIQLPGGATTNFSVDSDTLSFEAAFNSLAALNAAFPSGSYVLALQTAHFGTNTVTLPLTGDVYPASAPHITNFAAAQAINPIADFRVVWDPFSGGTSNDFIRVEVDDAFGYSVFETSNARGRGNFLNGTNNSVVIPGGTLYLGQAYDLNVAFVKITASNMTSIAGAAGLAGYAKRTLLSIRTTDVDVFGAVKGQAFSQTSTAAPVSTGFVFQSFIDTDSTNTVSSATLQLPAGSTQDLPATNGFSLEADFASQTAMDTAYPNGNYTITIHTVDDGVRVAVLNTSGNTYPVTTPRVSNFTAAQTINSESDFRLAWDALSGGTTNDYIQVQINDPFQGDHLFDSGQPGDPKALNGTNTSCLIPAGTLISGQSYDVQVLYAKLNRTNSYTNVVAFGGYFKRTDCPVKTTDVNYYGVVKGQEFSQTSAAAPVSQEFDLHIFLQTDNSGAVTNATVRLPNATTQGLTTSDGQSFSFDDGPYASQAAMDAADANGTYTLTINTVDDGTKTILLGVTGNTYPTNPPHISNFTAAQAIDPCADFALTWDLFSGGTTNDYVQLELQASGGMGNTLFRTAQFAGQPGALNGTNTFVVIPGDTLSPGRSYDARLLFVRGILNSSSYPGVLGIGGYYKNTQFNLKTTGTPIRPHLDITGDFQFGGGVYLHLTGEMNQDYTIEWADDLGSGNWTFLTSFTAYDGTYDTYDTPPAGSAQRFYRAREGF